MPWAPHAACVGRVPFLGGLSTWSSISPLAVHPSLASVHAYRHAPDDHCHAKIAQNLNSHSVATPPSFPCAQETYQMPGKGLSNSGDLDLSLTRQELNKVVHVENNMLFQQPRLDEASLAAAASQQPSFCCAIAPSCSSQCSSSTSTSTQPSSAQTMWRITKLDELLHKEGPMKARDILKLITDLSTEIDRLQAEKEGILAASGSRDFEQSEQNVCEASQQEYTAAGQSCATCPL